MDSEELEQQQKLHDVIEETLREDGVMDSGRILSGWVICYETISLNPEDGSSAGHFYGPREMTSWKALGLVEWVRRFSIGPGFGDGGDDEDDDD